MRPIVVIILCFSAAKVFAQVEDTPKLVAFDGYLLLEDSIPVENAFLINYRTMKIVATDSTGYFKTFAQPGDSLMINHLSLAPQIVHVGESPTKKQKIEVAYRTYMIRPVISNSYSYEMKNFEHNMEKLYAELRSLGYHPDRARSVRLNPYNPDEFNPGLTVSLSDLFGLFKRRR
ncbi:hypothetical protein [Mangrovibacterium diazotrophicum]|uniref:DUF4369 domain-containing protein n=1 Tax=Mangrovibacterium diazotrophicum TaxID=1261403 RepID=A0A419VUN4_9BACT|nr:hypothetical protein [Mangrovibacterium diazotrophicum]RKD85172.1 hypothetical protein BC643_4691 [Mangrovibacterium diazotrophicum]